MSTSIEELKQRLSGLNRRQSKSNDIWKPKGKHEVRLLPYPHGEDPFIELHFHYEIGAEGPLLCPKMNYGEDCAVCDFCDRLKAWKTPDGDDKAPNDKSSDWELFKKIQPKARVFIPMVERGFEGAGAKFWGLPPVQAMEILQEALDGDRLEECGMTKDEQDSKKMLQVLINPDKAYDLSVVFTPPGKDGNEKKFGITKVTAKIKTSPLSKDKKVVTDLLASVKEINQVYPRSSSAEVAKAISKWAGSAAPEAKATGGTEKYAKVESKPTVKTNSNEKSESVGKRTIDEAFGDMIADDEKKE